MSSPANLPAFLEPLSDFFVATPGPLLDKRTVQLLLIREVLDYTILRTEETREINRVATRRSATDADVIERVAFLATKQKGAESRELAAILRTADGGGAQDECYLKDRLCGRCPRCVLFGATDTTKGGDKGANIKHRVAYGTAFSLAPWEELREVFTFNGVSEATQRTGQTFNVRPSVRPASLFASIVTLRGVTWREFILVGKMLLSTTRYGAETRIGGSIRNTIYGIAAGWEEALTPLELAMELGDEEPTVPKVATIATEYANLGGFRDRSRVLSPAQVDQVTDGVQEHSLDASFLKEAYADAARYVQFQAIRMKNEKKGD